MTELLDNYAFETFPRGELRFQFNRRHFFSTLIVAKMKVYKEKNQGGLGYKLPQLGNLPDEQLALLIPVVRPDCPIFQREDFVWGQPPWVGRPIKLFPLDSPALPAFNRFNGLTPLGAVGRHLARERGWETARGFAYARGLFLHLVTLGVCIPK